MHRLTFVGAVLGRVPYAATLPNPIAISLILGSLAFGTSPASAQTGWADVLPHVKQHCADAWPDDYSMQAFCIQQQHNGWMAINGDNVPSHSNSAPSGLSPARAEMAVDAVAETAIIDTIVKYKAMYENATNDMIKGGLRPDRGRALCQLMPTLRVRNWRGTVYSLDSNNDGNGVLEIDLGHGVYVGTMNNELSDNGYNTLIPHGMSLYNDVSALQKGQPIEFSGTLFHDSVDCVHELSITVNGAMTEPEFLIRITSVKHEDDPVPTQSHGEASTSSVASTTTPVLTNPTAAGETAAFTDGRNGRIAYENWFAALSPGDYRNGAIFWASRRSLKLPPATCHYVSHDFEMGCLEAKNRLAPSDLRRKAEPDFKRGWNSL